MTVRFFYNNFLLQKKKYGAVSDSSLFSYRPGCSLVVLASLRATASIPQPFTYRFFNQQKK